MASQQSISKSGLNPAALEDIYEALSETHEWLLKFEPGFMDEEPEWPFVHERIRAALARAGGETT